MPDDEKPIFTKTEHLRLVERAIKGTIDDFFDPNNEANILFEQKRKELMDAEVKRQVKEQLEPQREAFANQTDKLTISYDEVEKAIGSVRATHHALLEKLDKIEQRELNSNEVYDTLTNLVANVTGLTGSLDKIIRLLERKSKTDRKMIA